jgi:hypothetical protein
LISGVRGDVKVEEEEGKWELGVVVLERAVFRYEEESP